MDVKIGSRWDDVIAEAIESGRFASAEDVVAEGLRHVAEQQAKFRWLKDKLDRALEEASWVEDAELDDQFAQVEAGLRARGVAE